VGYGASLFSAIRIQLNAIAEHGSVAGDRRKGYAVANTRIDRRARVLWKMHKAANPLCLRKGQRVKPHFELSHWAHFFAPDVAKIELRKR
jgi:hypothetical protein